MDKSERAAIRARSNEEIYGFNIHVVKDDINALLAALDEKESECDKWRDTAKGAEVICRAAIDKLNAAIARAEEAESYSLELGNLVGIDCAKLIATLKCELDTAIARAEKAERDLSEARGTTIGSLLEQIRRLTYLLDDAEARVRELEPKRGEWAFNETAQLYACSLCGNKANFMNRTMYCYDCGALMGAEPEQSAKGSDGQCYVTKPGHADADADYFKKRNI